MYLSTEAVGWSKGHRGVPDATYGHSMFKSSVSAEQVDTLSEKSIALPSRQAAEAELEPKARMPRIQASSSMLEVTELTFRQVER